MPERLKNRDISELLALRVEETEGQRQRAYRRAARHALYWPEEASALLEQDRPLSELSAVGPRIGGLIKSWIEEPPDLPEIPPLRQGFMTYAHARSVVADHPEWAQALRGDLQMHSLYSDGKEPIAAMAGEGVARGYDYIAMTDHSKGLKIAGGIDEDRLLVQAKEIAEVNAALDGEMVVLRSMEMNLSTNGEGDMEPRAFDGLETVVGSFHSSLRKTEDQTRRYIAGVTNPDVDILGHPICRQYSFRMGLSADWVKVAEAAVEAGTALELNSHPNRQDLHVDIVRSIADTGVLFSIGTDAHNTEEMRYIEIGMATAIEAGLDPDRVISTWPRDRLLEWAASNPR